MVQQHVILGSVVSEFSCLHLSMSMKIDLIVWRVTIHGVDIIRRVLSHSFAAIAFLFAISVFFWFFFVTFFFFYFLASLRHSHTNLGKGLRVMQPEKPSAEKENRFLMCS